MQSRRAPSSIGYLPALRKGDLLLNHVILRHALLGARAWSQCAIDIFGLPWNRSRHLFGCNAHWVATRVFANGLSARDVLVFHTLFGIYCHAASDATISRYVAAQTANSSRRRGFHVDGVCHAAARHLRSCRQCVEDDYTSRGFATWRVLHQVAALDRCPEHGDVLVNEWPRAGDEHRGTWPFFLPGDSDCHHLLAPTNAIPASDGYAAYLRLWLRLVHGDLTIVQPGKWVAFVQRLVDCFADPSEAASALEEAVFQSWGLPVHTVGHRVLLGGPSFILQELALQTRPRDVARRLVVYAAAQWLGIDVEPSTQLPLTLSMRSNSVLSADTQGWSALWSIVTDHGMPLVLASALRDDRTVRNIAHRTGTDPGRLGAFIASFPNELLLTLRQLQSWSEDSWLCRELERRRRQASLSLESRP